MKREPPSVPWADLMDADRVTAADMASYYRAVADEVEHLSPAAPHRMKQEIKRIETDQQLAMEQRVAARAQSLLTPKRCDEIASQFVARLKSDKPVWQEVLHYLHTVCFEGGPPLREKMDVPMVWAIQSDTTGALRYDPRVQLADERSLACSDLPRFAQQAGIMDPIEDRLWEAVAQSQTPAPLPSRIPKDAALLQVYVEGVKTIYRLVEHCLLDRSTFPNSDVPVYAHSFMSAGEHAFGVLYRLGLIKAVEGAEPTATPLSRYGGCPECYVVFAEPIDAVEEVVAERSEFAPSLGHVLRALDYMSGQYYTGFNLSRTPVTISKSALGFLWAAQAAGLALRETGLTVRLGRERAIWLPFCDPAVLDLFHVPGDGSFSDDKFDDLDKIEQLIRAWLPEAVQDLPAEMPWAGFHKQVIAPYEARLGRQEGLFREQFGNPRGLTKVVARRFGVEVY